MGEGGASKLRKAAKKMVVAAYSCGALIRGKAPPISDSSALSSAKPKGGHEGDQEVEIAEQRESTTSSNYPTKSLCAICLEPLNYKSKGSSPGQAIFTAQCSHAFHFSCISSNVRHGSVTCPICRAVWTQLPRNLKPSSTQIDPILRILDDSIATLRVHRRSFLRSARYDDDDPIELDHSASHSRLHLSLIHVPSSAPVNFHTPIQMNCSTPHSACPYHAPLHHHFTCGTSSLLQSPTRQMRYLPCNSSKSRACLSVKLAYQRATDMVLVACPNGPHLRLLKQAMALVVFSLRPIDRLAIVTYSSAAARVFPLKCMTSNGKRAALQIIDRLFYVGQADPVEGLKKAIKILEDRTHKNPESCILHLSDSPTPSYHTINFDVAFPIHRFHVGFGFGTSNGFVMHEFEEFLARLLEGVIRDIQLKIGQEPIKTIRIGELRGGQEKRILLDLSDCWHVNVKYSYVEGEVDECITTGESLVGLGDKSNVAVEAADGRDLSIGGRTSSVESWDYHDPFMARRWAKHLHGYRL